MYYYEDSLVGWVDAPKPNQTQDSHP